MAEWAPRAKALAVLAAVTGASALVGEALLRALPPEGRPFSGPVTARVEIGASREDVWSVVADIPAQVRWMPEMKEVRMVTPGPVREGSIGEATVRIFGIAVKDRVTITTFRPPAAFGIEHEGLFRGRGIMDLEPGPDRTTTVVTWRENLVPPWLPAVGWLVGRPVIAYLYQRDLELLRDVVEDASPTAAS
jgi:hypothetical protein